VAPVLATITATADQTTITNGAGSVTVGTVQDINTTSSPTWAGTTWTGKLDGGSQASPIDVTNTRKYGLEFHYSGNNYDVTGIRSRAQLVTTDTTATALGGLFQAANNDNVNAGVLMGFMAEAIGKSDTNASTITTMRGGLIGTEWGAKDTVTNLKTLHLRGHSRNAAGDGSFGTGYALYIENEAVGGNGQAYDAGIYFKGTNLSAGNKAFDVGVDFSGATYTTAVQNWPTNPVIMEAGQKLLKSDATNFNTIFGYQAAEGRPGGITQAQNEGKKNIFFGYRAGYYNDNTSGTDGENNFYVGYRAGYGAVAGNTGKDNIALGSDALFSNLGGGRNFALGVNALFSNQGGGNNVAIGFDALFSNVNSTDNMAIGAFALFDSKGAGNVSIGSNSTSENVNGNYNTVIGTEALQGVSGTTHYNMVCIGREAGHGVGNTQDSTYIGTQSGYSGVTARGNTAVGFQSAYLGSTGDCNVMLGFKAGYRQTGGSNLLIIDNQDRGSAAAEITDCLMYGVMHATPASQTLRLNVGDFIQGNPIHSDADGGGAMVHSWIREDGSGVPSVAATITVSHDGILEDDLAKMVLGVNTGSGVVDALAIRSTTDWVINKTSGVGIKVDLVAPTFGFADIIGDQFSKNTGATKPTLAVYNGAVQAWQFGDGDEAFMSFHIPHDHVPGTDIHLHIHWSQTSATATGGTLDFRYTAVYAKGHNRISGGTFTAVPITDLFSSIDINDGDSGLNQYQQHLTEITISAATATGALFDRDDFEPDGVIELTLEMDANNLTNSGAVLDPFIHYVDIHYQTTGVFGTKSRTPDFYA
jgi:hypothetical protein